jgi:hypothetical protein
LVETGRDKLIDDPFDKARAHIHVNRSVRKKWFLLGLVEAVPLFGGVILSDRFQLLFRYDCFVAGMILSATIILLLKDRSPGPPIGLKA